MNIVKIEQVRADENIRLCDRGLFRNKALILNDKYQWKLDIGVFSGVIFLEPRVFASFRSTYFMPARFIFEGKDNNFFGTGYGIYILGKLHSRKKYTVKIFKFKNDLLLTITYNE